MKKNKLYTVNRWNQPLFMERNLFRDGGSTNPFGVNHSAPTVSTPKIDWSNPVQRNMALGQTKGLTNSFGSGNSINLQQSNQMLSTTISGKTSGVDGGGNGLSSKGGAGWGMAGAAAGALGSANTGDPRGMWDTLDPVYHLADGRESAAGNAMSDAGVSLTQSGLSSGNYYLALAGAGLKIIGGLTNAAFGIKENADLKKDVEAGISRNKNFVSNAGSFDEVQGPVGAATNTDVYKGGWFSGDKARRKNEELKRRMIDARQLAFRSVDNNINNLVDDQMNDALANYSAYGGFLGDDGMCAINYGFMSDYLTQKKKETEAKNKMLGISPMPAINTFGHGGCFNPFALGGDVQMHGADFTNGLMSINAGGSHETNPNEGVQLGVDPEGIPNLVEEGETVFDDYVYSNRILADAQTKEKFGLPRKKDITFADISKKLEKESSERPNDPISQAGLKAQMHQLADEQERQKQEMDAQRAKAAFEALSPEEQVAVTKGAAQQEAMAEQAAMQQPSPEEIAMTQQQQAMADGSQAALGQEPQMMAEGGHLFKDGGDKMTKAIYKMLGAHTDSDIETLAKKNGLNVDDFWKMLSKGYGTDGTDMELWKKHVFSNPDFIKAVNNPALIDAINKGYDFGLYKPSENGKATIKSISKGNWKATNGAGWLGSDDPAWLEATKDMSEENIKKLSTEDVAKLLKNTSGYKKGTEWLQNKDNALLYLNTLIDDPDTPEVAKEYARKFVNDGKWKDGFNYDYATVFGSNGKGVRETNPGTYWHTPVEAVRGAQAKNFVIGDDGKVEEIVGDVPTDWAAAGNYSWATPENDMTYNYYRRPAAPEEKPVEEPKPEEPEKDIEPVRKADWLRYAGLFGPAVGLGMMAAGVGRPDTAQLDAAIEGAGDVTPADWKPLGNYLTYRPLDIWFEQNALNAQSRATDRALMNTSGGNRGTAMAGLLANGYNSQVASGNLFRQAQEYNDNLRKQVAEFNRGTDQFNSEQYGATSRFNADAYNNARRANAQLRLQAAAQKMDADAGWYNSLYGNVAGLFKGISDIGTENKRDNMINWMISKDIFGAVDPNDPEMKKRVKVVSAEGGKLKKNKRRGLTF